MISPISLIKTLRIGIELKNTAHDKNIKTPFHDEFLISPIMSDPNAAPRLPDPSKIPLTVAKDFWLSFKASPFERSAAAVAATMLNIPPTINPIKNIMV